MEDYFAAKRRLFEMLPAGAPGVVNARRSARRATSPSAAARPVTYADRRAGRRDARRRCRSSLDGLAFDVRDAARHACTSGRRSSAGRTSTTSSRAVATAVALDLPFAAIERGHRRARRRARPLPGRVGRRTTTSRVVVDYAHTDDALQEPARDGAAARAGPADHGVRLRRRSRSHQAAADGRGRGAAERPSS